MRTPWILLALAMALAGCSGPVDLDKDGDGVEDADETAGVKILVTTARGVEERLVTADPTKRDTDGDGLLDGEEMLVRNTDPRNPDTDGDGLLDGGDVASPPEETAALWRSLGILERDRVFLGEQDRCPPGTPQLKPQAYSSDLPSPDGLGDGEEIVGWTITLRGQSRHVTSDPCTADGDGDTLPDHDERRLGTDPRDADTDRDGTIDGHDADPLHDLGLRLGPAEFTRTNGTGPVLLRFALGDRDGILASPGNSTVLIDVPDASAGRDGLEVLATIQAEDLETGQRLAFFPDPRGHIVGFDLVKGTASGTPTPEAGLLRFEGADGTLTLRWAVDRA